MAPWMPREVFVATVREVERRANESGEAITVEATARSLARTRVLAPMSSAHPEPVVELSGLAAPSSCRRHDASTRMLGALTPPSSPLAPRAETPRAIPPLIAVTPPLERLRARFVGVTHVEFASVAEAVEVDAALGETHSSLRQPLVDYVLAHVAPTEIEPVLHAARTARAHRVADALEALDPPTRWRAPAQRVSATTYAVVTPRHVAMVPFAERAPGILLKIPNVLSVCGLADGEFVAVTASSALFFREVEGCYALYATLPACQPGHTVSGAAACDDNQFFVFEQGDRRLVVWEKVSDQWLAAPAVDGSHSITHLSVHSADEFIVTRSDGRNDRYSREESGVFCRDRDVSSDALIARRTRLPRYNVHIHGLHYVLANFGYLTRPLLGSHVDVAPPVDRLSAASVRDGMDEARHAAVAFGADDASLTAALDKQWWRVAAAILDVEGDVGFAVERLTASQRLSILTHAIAEGFTHTATRLVLHDFSMPWALAAEPGAQRLVTQTLCKGLYTLGRELLTRGAPLFCHDPPPSDTSAQSLWFDGLVELAKRGFPIGAHIHHASPRLLACTLPIALLYGDDMWCHAAACACDRASLSNANLQQALHDAMHSPEESMRARAKTAIAANPVLWAELEWDATLPDFFIEILRDARTNPVTMARLQVVPALRQTMDLFLVSYERRVEWMRRLAGDRDRETTRVDGNTDAVPDVLLHRDASPWRRAFDVRNGHGQDLAGLTRDWLFRMVEKVFRQDDRRFSRAPDDPSRLALSSDEPGEDLACMRFAGRVLGKALVCGSVPRACFTPHIYKMLLGVPVDRNDLSAFDGGAEASLARILAMDEADLAASSLQFPTDDRVVTLSNRDVFVDAYINHFLWGHCRRRFEEFAAGLFDIIPPATLRRFSVEEFRGLCDGLDALDLADWEAQTLPLSDEAHPDASRTRLVFWDAMRNVLSEAERRTLLRLVTGATHTPVGGFAALRPLFDIVVSESRTRVPVVHTCLHVIELPCRQTRDEMAAKLRIFIKHGDGFGLA